MRDSQEVLSQIFDLKNQVSNIKLQMLELKEEQERLEYQIDALLGEWRSLLARDVKDLEARCA